MAGAEDSVLVNTARSGFTDLAEVLHASYLLVRVVINVTL